MGHPTATPFQPLQPTAIPSSPGNLPPTGFFQATYNYFGIDFSNPSQRVNLVIDPPSKEVNRGKPITLSFVPASSCPFGDQTACVVAYAGDGNYMIFLTIHSGVGGQAQDFRDAVEGTGINQAGYSLAKVQRNMDALAGAEVAIIQGKRQINGLNLVGMTRIPPQHVQAYLSMPVQDALSFATQLDEKLMGAIDPTRPMLVFETCGWKMPGEPWYPGISDTTGSIYLGVIQNLP